jgi:hypothetical protein
LVVLNGLMSTSTHLLEGLMRWIKDWKLEGF